MTNEDERNKQVSTQSLMLLSRPGIRRRLGILDRYMQPSQPLDESSPKQSECKDCVPLEELPKTLSEFGIDIDTRAIMIGLKVMSEQGDITEKELKEHMPKLNIKEEGENK